MEDQFGAWTFVQLDDVYSVCSPPFPDVPQVASPDGFFSCRQHFGKYSWHMHEPLRAHEHWRVTM